MVFNDKVNDEREEIWEKPVRDPIRGLKKNHEIQNHGSERLAAKYNASWYP
jgi:hypothetical protein